jgi:hypothetical protein
VISPSEIALDAPPTRSLALTGYPDVAGTASSVIGVARWVFGGLIAPLVGLGEMTAVPLTRMNSDSTTATTGRCSIAHSDSAEFAHHQTNNQGVTDRKPLRRAPGGEAEQHVAEGVEGEDVGERLRRHPVDTLQ